MRRNYAADVLLQVDWATQQKLPGSKQATSEHDCERGAVSEQKSDRAHEQQKQRRHQRPQHTREQTWSALAAS